MNSSKFFRIGKCWKAFSRLRGAKKLFGSSAWLRRPTRKLFMAAMCSAGFLTRNRALMECELVWEPRSADLNNKDRLLVLAKRALERSDFSNAENIINVAIDICERKQKFDELPELYEAQSAIAFAEGDITKAENITVAAVERLTQYGYEDTNNSMLNLKLRLARIHCVNGKLTLSDLGYKWCVNTLRDKVADGDLSKCTVLLYISSLFWYGVHNIKCGNFTEARNLLRTAYEFADRVQNVLSLQDLAVFQTLSDLYHNFSSMRETSFSSVSQLLNYGLGS